MPGELVAVTLAPGPEWVDIVRAVWDSGAALLPIDHRLPATDQTALLRRARPTLVLGPGGRSRPPGGIPTEPGVALVIHTSGTRGEPKLAQFDHRAVDAAVAASASALHATPQDRWLCCLPLAHVGGLLVLLRSVLLGAPVRVHPTFDPAAVSAERGAPFVSLVPTMLLRLLDAGVDLSRFRALLVGGAALDASARERAEAADARVVQTYGLTESCGGVVYDGRPFPGTAVRLDPGTGEIQLRGPTLMRGYREDPPSTASAFTPDGWLRTGDAGKIEPDGRLRVEGRLDDLITTGGEKVWPHEVEEALRDHPKVADVAVAARPDAEWGERVVAFLVPREPADPPSLEEIRDHVSRTLPRFKAPRELVVLPRDVPRTSSGKIRRAALH